MSKSYAVTASIPLPPRRGALLAQLKALKVNESFALPGAEGVRLQNRVHELHRATRPEARHASPERYCTKTLAEDGVKVVRVWRLS